MMKCQSCNSELVAGARFCDKCGAPVQELWSPPQAGPDMTSEPVAGDTPVAPFTPPPSPDPAPFQFPTNPADFQPAADDAPPTPVNPPASGDKFVGMQRSQLGTITLILGILGLVFSCVGCGGLPAIAGLITGFASLKSSSDSKGKIGLVLSGLGLIIAIIVTCVVGGLIISNSPNYGY